MDQMQLDAIVSQVTQQVLAALQQQVCAGAPREEGLRKALVVGGTSDQIPQELAQDTVFYDLEDYRTNQNILRYDQIILVKLNITQLSDIAHGRIGDEVSCAVLHGLLNGVETVMLEDALSFRKFAGKGSTALYHLLESFAQTLQVFGVKPVGRKRLAGVEPPPAKPPKYKAPTLVAPKGSAQPNAGRLVTEAEAMAMVKSGQSVQLPAGTIVTPAAKDVFAQAGISWAAQP